MEETIVRASFLDSSNSVEKLCDSWVQTRGYEACVFCMPIPLRVCQARAPTRRKPFLRNYGKQKNTNKYLTTAPGHTLPA